MVWDAEYSETVLAQYRDDGEPAYRDEFTERYAPVPSRELPGSMRIGPRAPDDRSIRSDVVVRFGGEDDVFAVVKGGDEVDELEYDRYLAPR